MMEQWEYDMFRMVLSSEKCTPMHQPAGGPLKCRIPTPATDNICQQLRSESTTRTRGKRPIWQDSTTRSITRKDAYQPERGR